MNGTAARRTAPAPLLRWAPPPELVGGLDAVHPSPAGHPRGKSSLRGLLVQATYAAIDVMFVCLGGITIFLLRFSLVHGMGITAELFRSPSAQAYLGFFLLYAALIVLSCVSYNLYRTPRERTVFGES